MVWSLMAEELYLLQKALGISAAEDSNDWFKSYLSNRNHYVSINGYDSVLHADLNHLIKHFTKI